MDSAFINFLFGISVWHGFRVAGKKTKILYYSAITTNMNRPQQTNKGGSPVRWQEDDENVRFAILQVLTALGYLHIRNLPAMG